jgi:hypothetical protein
MFGTGSQLVLRDGTVTGVANDAANVSEDSREQRDGKERHDQNKADEGETNKASPIIRNELLRSELIRPTLWGAEWEIRVQRSQLSDV